MSTPFLPPEPPEFSDQAPLPHESWYVRWRPTMIAFAILATVVAVVVVNRENPSISVDTTVPAVNTGPVDNITGYPLTRIVKHGSRGADVRRIQQRLKDLHFDPGTIDGVYGGDTKMAVWAFQGVVLHMKHDTQIDSVTPTLWDEMRAPVTITPRRQPGTPSHVEVYLPEQALVVFKGSEVQLVSHISSGSGEHWCEEVTIDPGEEGNVDGTAPLKTGVCGDAITPGGIYYFYKRNVGTRQSRLGTMWNPVYFNFGIAVHGAAMVPNTPASHGCIRIPIFISNYFPSLVAYGDRVYVFDGVQDPEVYGSPPPPWDKHDPNYTTTTSTSLVPTTLPGTKTSTSVKTTTTTTIPPVGTATTMPGATTLP